MIMCVFDKVQVAALEFILLVLSHSTFSSVSALQSYKGAYEP